MQVYYSYYVHIFTVLFIFYCIILN